MVGCFLMSLEDLTDVTVGDSPIDTSISMPKEKKDDQYNEITPYNPFISRPNQTWDDRAMDRMIAVHKPEHTKSGEIWFTEGKFVEVLSLLPLSQKAHQRYVKKYKRIQMLQTGDLNRKIVDSRQDRLLYEILAQKSILDAVEGGNINERGHWITNRQYIEQTLRQSLPSRPKGFIESVADGIAGRR
jgi:hypothetical protein